MKAKALPPEILREVLERRILLVRGRKVWLDADLAWLYGIQTGALHRAVKRHAARFPDGFMFQLTAAEAGALRCQTGISRRGGGPRRNCPHVFTEQGVAMLSGVLRGPRAASVSVAIIRAFVSLRRRMASDEALASGLAELEGKLEGHDEVIRSFFDAIRELMEPLEKPRHRNGFRTED